MNKVILKGRLTADVEYKVTQTATKYAAFSVAVPRRFSKNDETDFINCKAFDKTADFISKYFQKGQEILICGEIRVNKWTDNNGNNRYSTEVLVNEVDFCGSKQDNAVQGSAHNVPQEPAKMGNKTEEAKNFFDNISDNFDDLPDFMR